jgi:hypothetical protein
MVATRPRAYTTIMTILDRLAQKGIVERRKKGRAWVYRANMSEHEARSQAIERLVEGFFAGSEDALRAHLGAEGARVPREPVKRDKVQTITARRRASAATVTPAAPEPEEAAFPALETTLL